MSLAFLSPALLAGLALCLVPLVVHLISKRRARRVRFAAIEFVLRSQKRTARSIRLRQILLLIVRTLLIAAVALAVAQPLLVADERPSGTDAPLVAVLAIDVSASMHAVEAGQSGFERARRRAEEVLGGLDADVRAAVVGCDHVPVDVVGAPTFDRGQVQKALDVLEPAYGTSDLAACVARSASIAGAVHGEGERRVIVLSDLAAHAVSPTEQTSGVQGLTVEWIPVFDDAVANQAITDVSLARVSAGLSHAVEIRFSAVRFADDEAEAPADLWVDEQRAARLSLPLLPGTPIERAFTHPFAEDEGEAPATHDVRVRLADDPLSLDNEVRLAVELPKPVKVVVVDGAPQPIPFRDEVYYLESALSQRKAGRARLSVEVVNPDAVDAGLLADTRVLVLANVARLPDGVAPAVVEFVRAGGGLFITMGDQVDVDWMNASFKALLPGRLRGAKGQALLDDASVAEVLGLTRFDRSHPAFQGLREGEAGGLRGLRRVETTTLMLLEPQPDAPREVLATFTSGSPALVERRVENGRVALLATTIDRDWSDLAIRPGFLPLVQQLVLYLGSALERSGPAVIEVRTPREVPVPRGTTRLEIRPPSGEAAVLTEEDLVTPDGEPSGSVTYFRTHRPGLYQVFAQRDGGDLREVVGERFTVVIPRSESDLTRADESRLQQATPGDAARRRSGEEDDDVALWPWLLLAAVGLLLGESLILRRRGGL